MKKDEEKKSERIIMKKEESIEERSKMSCSKMERRKNVDYLRRPELSPALFLFLIIISYYYYYYNKLVLHK